MNKLFYGDSADILIVKRKHKNITEICILKKIAFQLCQMQEPITKDINYNVIALTLHSRVT